MALLEVPCGWGQASRAQAHPSIHPSTGPNRARPKVEGLETSEEIMMAHQRPKCRGTSHEGTIKSERFGNE